MGINNGMAFENLKGGNVMISLKVSGVILLTGSILFLAAALSPISRIFGVRSAAERLEIIQGSRSAWNISQALFAAGAIVFALGTALMAYQLAGRPSTALMITAAVLLTVGAAAWTWHVYLRALDPAAFAEGFLPGWHFKVYGWLAMTALVLIGIALLRMGFPAWSGYVFIGGGLLFAAAYLLFKDVPPFLFYLPGMALAIMLIRGG